MVLPQQLYVLEIENKAISFESVNFSFHNYIIEGMNNKDNNQTLIYLVKQLQVDGINGHWKKVYQNSNFSLDVEQMDNNHSKSMDDFEVSSVLNISNMHQNQTNFFTENSEKKTKQFSEFKTITYQLLKEHLFYKKTVLDLKLVLQDIVNAIHNTLSKTYKDIHYFSDFSEDCHLQETLNMAKFIKSTIKKIGESQNQFTNYEEQIKKMKVEQIVLQKKNENLLSYIDERKSYSQKLKQKIYELKEQLKQVTKKNQKNQKLVQELNALEDNVDLKYRNRNDLIVMIRCLATKILKHEKQCLNAQNKILSEGIQKLLNKSTQTKKKSFNAS